MLRAAVIGLGVGVRHATAYLDAPGIEAVAVCSRRGLLPPSATALRDVPVHTDAVRMLDEFRPHVVSICTPPASHLALCQAAASRGIHVLVEKPMAPTVEACSEMLRLCEQHGVLLMVAHKKRFAPPLVLLHELTAADAPLGPVRQLSASYRHGGTVESDWFWKHDDGGGPLLENQVHTADTIAFLVGLPVRVYADGASRFSPARAPEPDVAGYVGRFAGRGDDHGDALVTVSYGMIGPVPFAPLCDERWSFSCERGVAEVIGPFERPHTLRWALRRGLDAPVHERSWPDANLFSLEIAHFLDCVRTGTQPRADGLAGLRAVAFCLAVKESVRCGEVQSFAGDGMSFRPGSDGTSR